MARLIDKVFIVDDDSAVRDGLALLIETAGLEPETFGSAEEFLTSDAIDRSGCLILDLKMPGMSGIELQDELIRRRSDLPIIFLTGYAEIPTTVRAIKAGAVDFLTKPLDPAVLLDRVRVALEKVTEQTAEHEEEAARRSCFLSLTRREQQVLSLLLRGRANKEIGRSMGISYRTVEVHRSRIMAKTGTSNLLELVRLAEEVGISAAEPAS